MVQWGPFLTQRDARVLETVSPSVAVEAAERPCDAHTCATCRTMQNAGWFGQRKEAESNRRKVWSNRCKMCTEKCDACLSLSFSFSLLESVVAGGTASETSPTLLMSKIGIEQVFA